MKQKDIALIIVIVAVSGIFSYIVANFLIAPSSSLTAEVEIVGPITSDFQQVEGKYFNDAATNPTQVIRIGEGNNQNPFNSGQN